MGCESPAWGVECGRVGCRHVWLGKCGKKKMGVAVGCRYVWLGKRGKTNYGFLNILIGK